MTPVDRAPFYCRVGKCARSVHGAAPIHLFPVSSLINFSRSEAPVGRQLTFVMGYKALSAPLQNGIRFFRHLHPAAPTASLTGRLPRGQGDGVYKFRLCKCIGLGACYRPGSLWSTMPQLLDEHPTSGAFWLKPVSLFGLFSVTTFITDSHMFTLPTI